MSVQSAFDIHRPTCPAEASACWSEMRERDGLSQFTNLGGFYVAARYDDVMKVLMTPEVFGSGKGITLPPPDGIRSFHIPAEIDPPEHREYRGVIQPMLDAALARAMEPGIREIVRDLVARIPDGQPIDFVRALARPLPIVVALDLMRISRDRADEIEAMVEDLHHEVASGHATGAAVRLKEFAESVLAERSGDIGQDMGADIDVVMAILTGKAFGRPLTHDEQMSMVRQILVGGFDTTSIALATMAKWLAEHPEHHERLRGDAKLVDTACEEIVRLSSPSTYLRREVMQPTELAGTSLKVGDSVLIAFGAANHDVRKFACPGEVVPDRRPNPHVGFGAGRHRCIGSFVAKAQMRVACEELLTSFVQFEIDGGKPIQYSTGLGQGITALPMVLSRHAR